MIPQLNPLLLTDVYNLSHQMLKENTYWEVSHIVNRRPMFLFGFDAIAHEVLEYRIYAKDVGDAAKKAKAMLYGCCFKAISVSNDGLVDGRCVRPNKDRSII